MQLSIFGTVSFALPLCAKARPKSDAASQMSLLENREEANIVTPKKGRPLNLGLIGRQKRFLRACREGKPARKRPHLRLDGGALPTCDVTAYAKYHIARIALCDTMVNFARITNL